MLAQDLRLISRTNALLGVAATATAGLIWGPRGALAAAVGATLAWVNFWVLRRFGAQAAARASEGEGWSASRLPMLGAGLILKMTALFGLVWVAIRVLRLAAVPFALGFSAFVVSILAAGLFIGLGQSKREA